MTTDAELDPSTHGADAAAATRGWLLSTRYATLCTTSVKPAVAGHPYGSVVPFALDARGRPFIYVANMAAHTGNLRRDPRASLLVRDPAAEGDPQASWRVTIMGRMARVDRASDEWPRLAARYRARVPRADVYRKTHSFDFWRMEAVDAVRFIGGFGRIMWLPGAAIEQDAHLGAAAQGAIDHLNADHRHNLDEICRGLAGFAAPDAEAVALDATGLLVRSAQADRLAWFEFGQVVDAGGIRRAVIEVLQAARRASAAR